MTIREAVKWGAKRLRDNNVDNADHDSFELLSAINGMTRTFYLVNGDSMLSEENLSKISLATTVATTDSITTPAAGKAVGSERSTVALYGSCVSISTDIKGL